MTADVLDLAERRAAQQERERDRQMSRAQHPSLRWVAGIAFYVAHARDDDGAVCGAVGDLVLAPPGVPLCVQCYPLRERGDAV